MKIFKHQMTVGLPETVSECKGMVFMVFDDGARLPINENEAAMRLFKKLWESGNRDSVELICADRADNSRFLRMMSLSY